MSNIACAFCEKSFHDRNGIILHDNSNYIISDISPIVKNHLLIVPNIHYYSFARTSNRYLNLLTLYIDIIKNYFTSLGFNNFVLFEHGGPTCGDTDGCGIYHAHLHAIPLIKNIDIHKGFNNYLSSRKTDFSFNTLQSIIDIRTYADYFYLMIIDYNSIIYIYYSNLEFESQILRKFVAERINNDYNYTWKKYYNPQSAVRCTNDFLFYLNHNKL